MQTQRQPRLLKAIDACILAVYTAMMGAILLCVLFFFERMSFFGKKAMLLPQWALLLLGATALLLLASPFFLAESAHPLPARKARARWLLKWAAVFAAQASLCYFSYFICSWDPYDVTKNAYYIATGYTQYIDHHYFSMYPNNVTITAWHAALMSLFNRLSPGVGFERQVLILAFFQCAVNTATGMLLERLALRLTGSRRFARLATVVYVAWVGLSPWVTIPYSDSLALFFPLALLNLYDLSRRCGRSWLCWLGISALIALGALIKPQTAILPIALLSLEAIRLIRAKQISSLLSRLACVLLAVWLGIGPGFRLLSRALPIERDEDGSVGVLHYAMMGLNLSTNGVFSGADLLYSTQPGLTKSERTALQLQMIKSRLAAMDLPTWRAHLIKKTLTNYADGTFAWGVDTGVEIEIADKDAVISPFLKELFNPDSGRFSVYQSACQGLWLSLLLFSLFSLRAYRALPAEDERFLLSTMLLTLVGSALFQTLFEARSRYLMTFAPVYVLVGLLGVWSALALLRRAKER